MSTPSNSTEKLKVAVVGLGYFSQFHLDSWDKMEGVELVAVCDVDVARTAEVSKEYKCSGFTDLAEMLEASKPDIVDLVIPPSAQANAIEQAVESDRLLICQKPFCQDLEEAARVTKLAKDTNCSLIVHENFRFQPWYRSLKAMIDAGKLGTIFQAQFFLRPGDGRGKDAYLDRQPSFQTMEKFLIHETGVHFIDLHQWLFGEIQSVYADLYQLNPHIAGEDAGKVIFRHASGARSEFDGNRSLDHAAENLRCTMGEMVVEGSAGTAKLDGFGVLHFRPFKQLEWNVVHIEEEVDHDAFGGGCVHALNRHSVLNYYSKNFENTAQEYLRIIKIENAIYRSNEDQKVIEVR